MKLKIIQPSLLEAEDSEGYTCLHLAVISGNRSSSSLSLKSSSSSSGALLTSFWPMEQIQTLVTMRSYHTNLPTDDNVNDDAGHLYDDTFYLNQDHTAVHWAVVCGQLELLEVFTLFFFIFFCFSSLKLAFEA